MTRKFQIGFIYLEETHHLYHFLSVAVALSKNHDSHIITHEYENGLTETLLELYPDHAVKINYWKTKSFRRFTDLIKSRKLPRKGFWYKKNASKLLNNYDALVFSDYHHHVLKKLRKGNKPYLLKISHGILGRNYAVKKDLLDFDFHVFTGENMNARLKSEGYEVNHAVAGLAKLDVVKKLSHKSIFKNGKKTVIYTPHFSPPHSSWHQYGLKILDFFASQSEYNLIFAPHVNLFNKVGSETETGFATKYTKFENIHIDLGSRKSVEMAYINEADIYLGDASSQVLEFILKPRPCIFFDAEGLKHPLEEFEFWKLGQIVKSIDELKLALDRTEKDFQSKKELQVQTNSSNVFTEPTTTVSERYAMAIENFLTSRSEQEAQQA